MILKRLDSFNVATARLLRKNPAYADTVIDFCARFMHADSPADLHGASIHRVEKAKSPDVWTAYASDSIRVIMRQRGAAWYAAHIHSVHDEPYEWAERHAIELPRTKGADGGELVGAIETEAPDDVGRGAGRRGAEKLTSCFDPFDDDALLELGVPRIMIPMLREVPTVEDFIDRAYPRLPEELGDALFGALTGEFGAVTAGLARARELEAGEGTQEQLPLSSPVVTEVTLEKLAEAPELSWVALPDATQMMAATGSYAGPVLVTGAAGTGKTVVGIHRAVFLATQGRDVLLTTYTRALCDFLRAQLFEMWSPTDEGGNITVSTLDSLALGLSGEQKVPGGRRSHEGWTQICQLAADRLAHGIVESPYNCLVVDEVQDLSPERLALVKALAGDGADSLTMLGDTDQRIYNEPLDLEDFGFDFEDRVIVLETGYRTTREISEFADLVLDDTAIRLHSTAYASGPAPRLLRFTCREHQEVWIALKICGYLLAGAEPAGIAVLARTNTHVSRMNKLLLEFGLQTAWGLPLVCVQTMHKAKGQEYETVFVMDADDDCMPLPKALEHADSDAGKADVLLLERNLLHVAVSRATDQVFISSCGTPSPLLDRALENGYSFEDADFHEVAEFDGDPGDVVREYQGYATWCEQELRKAGVLTESDWSVP